MLMDFSAIHVIVGFIQRISKIQKKFFDVVYRHLFAYNDILRFKTFVD